MEIYIRHLLDGAKQAIGCTVIIDVFRAFTLEAYAYHAGAQHIFPVGSIDDAMRLKEKYPMARLVGERDGIKIEGFDYGNSPSLIANMNLENQTIIHTTSAGTQGLVNAINAQVLLTGSLVNAKAIASYILQKQYQTVSLVCMGWKGMKQTEEDVICAEYIKSLLLNQPYPLLEKLKALKYQEGKKFFDPAQQSVFPENDFWYSIDYDKFPFVILVRPSEIGFQTEKIEVKYE